MGNYSLQYSMLIQRSEEDAEFLVTLPEWDGRVINPVTHGETYEEAVKRGREVLELLVELSRKEGRPLPEPNVPHQDATQQERGSR